MSSIRLAILDYIIGALADARGPLDEIKLFIRGGAPHPVDLGLHPFVEVEIAEEGEGGESTGGEYGQTYVGLITLTVSVENVAGGDWLMMLDDRKAAVPSADKLDELVTAMLHELQKAEHRDMGGLTYSSTDANEQVTDFYITGPRVYGLDDRTNNYANFASIPFVVNTDRQVALDE